MALLIAYCETVLQIDIAVSLARASTSEVDFRLLICQWNDQIGQAATEAELPVVDIRKPPNFENLRPAEQMTAIRGLIRNQLPKEGGIFIAFQDQHIYAQATIAGARDAGWRYALVQDGYLDFDMTRIPAFKRKLWPVMRALNRNGVQGQLSRVRNALYKELYFSNFFGHTQADWTFVFGKSLAHRLTQQFNIPPKNIFVSGPTQRLAHIPKAPRPLQQRDKISIVFFDQCFLRYKRIKRYGWETEYLPIIRTLSNYDTWVKLHPAQTAQAANDIALALGDKNRILGQELLNADHIKTADVAVTVTSSSFLHCIARGLPVVFVDIDSSFDRMPTIQSALIRNVSSITELRDVIEQRRRCGEFLSNDAGENLSTYVNINGGGATEIMQQLTLEL